ncbi:MAG TPA: pyruvate formate lyase family protein [Clostridiaceae bacterium]
MEHVLAPIRRDELIVGFMAHGYVGFSTQFGGIYVYYFHRDKVEASLLRISDKVDIKFIEEIRAMINFWEEEQTIKKLQNRFKDKYGYVLPGGYQMPGIANADGRIAGTNVDFDKLVKLGIPGLRSEIAQYENTYFYQGLNLFLDAFLKACDFYIENATSLLEMETDEKRKGELKDIIETLNSIKVRNPASFREGVQLVWLYCVITDTMNYGRMDVYLGDLYSKDIKDKLINEEDGIAYLSSLWRQFVRVSKIHDCRVIIGGVGRRNEINADALAMIIMEVSRRLMGYLERKQKGIFPLVVGNMF